MRESEQLTGQHLPVSQGQPTTGGKSYLCLSGDQKWVYTKCRSKTSQERKLRLCAAHGFIPTLIAVSLLVIVRRHLMWHQTTKYATSGGHQEAILCLINGVNSDTTATQT